MDWTLALRFLNVLLIPAVILLGRIVGLLIKVGRRIDVIELNQKRICQHLDIERLEV